VRVNIKMKKIRAAAMMGIAGFMLIAQSAPVRHTNPPSKGDFAASPEIISLFRQACYECHSNETRWPWYSYVPPVSWLIAREVESGRRELNFSEWDSYYPTTRQRKLQWIDRVLRERTMPPWNYVILHQGANLTEENLVTLQQWIKSRISLYPEQILNR
jgi:heme-binding protein